MTKCKICGRKLSNTTSVKQQMGASCRRRWKAGCAGVQSKAFGET